MTLQVADYFFQKTLSVLRPQVGSGGISAPVEVLTDVRCSYVHPHDTDLDILDRTETFRAQWVVYCESVEIRIGDVLIVDDEEYEVERVNRWGTHYLECRLLQEAM